MLTRAFNAMAVAVFLTMAVAVSLTMVPFLHRCDGTLFEVSKLRKFSKKADFLGRTISGKYFSLKCYENL